ncbi:hypothetical protein TRM7557_00396 [Tritonibacter multivorans]|uniref:DUF1178 family protein n=1 Tax=Tritonibacter multivorans TaxID=928856 RepID=A0A0N7LYP7_9RHOB|nr:DUF1178 family protein [Tritonibacter multivorans]MDA7419435.1 DUF1178 family protein [Tritonibacter multivorans]CUH75457.1 hypothetical protein TRM7557_00396 [Tritonibacter multivorans]SFC67345.1 hypothetical protein SAMN04488049_103388 [Tritonibacter multivorans]
MIRYALKCAEGHSFESWFQSASAYDKLAAAGMVTCAVCGSTSVEKAIMAPRVRPARSAVSSVGDAPTEAPSATTTTPAQTPTPVSAAAAIPAQAPATPSLSAPNSDLERAVSELRKQVEANSDYVGGNFAEEARAMHLGDAPERAIHGEAKPEEARALLEEGVPVMPLPFLPSRKTN